MPGGMGMPGAMTCEAISHFDASCTLPAVALVAVHLSGVSQVCPATGNRSGGWKRAGAQLGHLAHPPADVPNSFADAVGSNG